MQSLQLCKWTPPVNILFAIKTIIIIKKIDAKKYFTCNNYKMTLNISLANNFISSTQCQTLNTNSNEVHSELWSILFGPILSMTLQQREKEFVEWDSQYVRAFNYAVAQDDVKYGLLEDIEKQKRFGFYFMMFLYH